MAKIRINLDDTALRQTFALLGKDISVAAMELLATDAMRITGNKFRAQGPGWPGLSPFTLKRRRNLKGTQVAILQDTGRLRNSIIDSKGDADGIWSVSPGSIEFGSNLIYAATHQFGRKNKPNTPGYWGDIPARPYLPEESELADDLQRKLERILRELVDGK